MAQEFVSGCHSLKSTKNYIQPWVDGVNAINKHSSSKRQKILHKGIIYHHEDGEGNAFLDFLPRGLFTMSLHFLFDSYTILKVYSNHSQMWVFSILLIPMLN